PWTMPTEPTPGFGRGQQSIYCSPRPKPAAGVQTRRRAGGGVPALRSSTGRRGVPRPVADWSQSSSATPHLSNKFRGYVPSLAAMDLRQLNAVVAVADEGSFSAAADALHTVQSNVSTHVARLERELGAPLIDRSNGCRLTEEGQAVVERARRVAAELDALVSDVAALRNEVRGSVSLGV